MASLLQKLIFRLSITVTITDADIGSSKSLRTLFNKYLDHMLVKFEQNRTVGNIQNFFGISPEILVFKVCVFTSDFKF